MTTIDISLEAVEPPCTCHPDDQPPNPCPQKYALNDCHIAALSAALAQSRAETAAAYELAATAIANVEQFTRWKKGKWKGATAQGILLNDAQNAIRALATPDQSSALAAVIAAAEARGMRKAAKIVDGRKGSDGAPLYHPYDKGYIAACGECQRAILAAIPLKGEK